MNTIAHWQMPAWVAEFVDGWSEGFETPEKRLGFAADLALANVQAQTGGPFGAAIFDIDSSALVAPGMNLVTTVNASIAHAEMVAITTAQRVLQTFDLSSRGRFELATSVEPCAMCLGAIPWSGVQRVLTGATAADAEAIGFNEGAKPSNWQRVLTDRGIEVYTEIERDRAARALNEYASAGGAIYNGDSGRD